ncbi:glutamine synthetase [Tupanvirus deep ocean]|uniref:Glutamine synthetase n=2 Tax=Tupanvirus TaxID=2094720 RepID=A0AC62A7L0_9VIRU|nr:glutamine synthetase [Tupanvirus deep ocean]QKU33642.1 glutamine synthetase [Tupanvirus deep ocean]
MIILIYLIMNINISYNIYIFIMEHTVIDYVWIGGKGELRSKTRVLPGRISNLEDIPSWNYDGSSTDQADGGSSEIFIYPKRLFRCPFRRPNGFIVMCDAYTPDGQPAIYNHRYNASHIFNKYIDQKPWYGLEQEYFIFDMATDAPLGFNPKSKQGRYYCSVGGRNAFGREISDKHLEACLYAGITISGTNAEVAPGQWEYQVGPVEGIDAADQLWISRYILDKITEDHGAYIVYHPKPLVGDWNGSGCHTNFSTEAMRNDGGLNVIMSSMNRLKEKHMEHMKVYGKHNKERMSGDHETSSYDEFTYGIGSRKSSVRIPNEAVKNGKGYFEDRRPGGNVDPYQVTSIILETVMS